MEAAARAWQEATMKTDSLSSCIKIREACEIAPDDCITLWEFKNSSNVPQTMITSQTGQVSCLKFSVLKYFKDVKIKFSSSKCNKELVDEQVKEYHRSFNAWAVIVKEAVFKLLWIQLSGPRILECSCHHWETRWSSLQAEPDPDIFLSAEPHSSLSRRCLLYDYLLCKT